MKTNILKVGYLTILLIVLWNLSATAQDNSGIKEKNSTEQKVKELNATSIPAERLMIEAVEKAESIDRIESSNKIDNPKVEVIKDENTSQIAKMQKQGERKTNFEKLPVEAKIDGNASTGSPKAPPSNDACSTHPVFGTQYLPLDGTCITGQTNIDATPDYYGGCVPTGDASVWYRFTLTGSNNMITITFTVPGSLGGTPLGQGNDVNLFLFSGTSCTGLTGISTICGPVTQSFVFEGLTAGVNYWVQVSTSTANTGNFNICATQSIRPTGSLTGPEQDCIGALPVCLNNLTFTGSYYGYGDEDEVSTSTCLLSGETNSVWYVFTPQNSGSLAFTIATTRDYDFALYDLTDIGGCENIPTSMPIRCNWSSTLGNTGLDLGTATTQYPAISYGAAGTPMMPGITNVTAGHTYALIIDNWTGDNNGFTITFSGTASIVDGTPPTITSVVPSCTDNTIMITMSEDVLCTSIQQEDFTLYNNTTSTNFTGAIISILGYNCPTTDGAITNQILLTHNGTLTYGNYTLTLLGGSGLSDKCGNVNSIDDAVSFNYLPNISLSASSATICSGGTVTLDANGIDGTGATYTLTPGGLTNNTNGIFGPLSPPTTTNYQVSVTYGGCTKTASTTVTVEGNIIAYIDPPSRTLCSGTTNITASATINGENCTTCSYLWSTGQTNPTITVGPGTYSVTVTSAAGCTNSNSPTSVILLASSGTGAGTCDVIYVSPAGGGTGLTKESPTDLATAIANAQCTNATIKMQRGIYTLTAAQAIHSYATIEGGYDATFSTKSSDLSGGTNSTTIRRTNAGTNGTDCVAFLVDDGAESFRIQDIRIELPGSPNVPGHAAGSNRTNYGIKLGAGCTNYTIVRCYIDAGVGSAP